MLDNLLGKNRTITDYIRLFLFILALTPIIGIILLIVKSIG